MNFAPIFAISCLTLSVAIPGGLYVASEVQNKVVFDGPGKAQAISLWITTPAFTLIDTEGGRHQMVAAVGTRSKAEAERLCKYLPIVRDRLQEFASSVRVTAIDGGQPKLRGKADSLPGVLAGALGFSADPKVKIIDSRHSVQTVIKTRPATCQGGRLGA